jgi:hypothetical protein
MLLTNNRVIHVSAAAKLSGRNGKERKPMAGRSEVVHSHAEGRWYELVRGSARRNGLAMRKTVTSS